MVGAAPRLAEAIAHHRAGRAAEADRLYRDVLAAEPEQVDALNLLGVLAHQRGDHAGAAALIERAIELRPGVADFHNNLGEALRGLGRIDDAARQYRRALDCDPDHAHAHGNLGLIALEQNRHEEATAALARAVALKPDSAPFQINLGRALAKTGRIDDALASFSKADAPYWTALTLHRQGMLDGAIDHYRIALDRDPDRAEARSNLAAALVERGEPEAALPLYQAALAQGEGTAAIYNNLALALHRLGRLGDADDHYQAALARAPSHPDTLNNLGDLRVEQGRVTEALALYERALAIDPDHDHAYVNLVARANLICDWTRLAKYLPGLAARLERIAATGANADSLIPLTFTLPYVSSENTHIRAVATLVGESLARSVPRLAARGAIGRTRRLKIGYLSPDFGDHPISHVTRPIYGLHDRDRFEVLCYSLLDRAGAGGPHLDSIRSDCDRFVDLAKLSDRDAAERIAADRIDILIDLSGYMRHNRARILAMKPAPLQAYWQGHTGTLGAPYIDYVIGDEIMMPPEDAEFFTEKVVRLPDTFSSADRPPIAEVTQRRLDFGLPETGIVLCAFNNPLKIEPETFDAWMRILAAAPQAVLWLSESKDPAVRDNLGAAARARGIDPARLVFASRIPDKAEHLARHRLADLFLDTFKFNASTTALDALWTGLPIVARRGNNAYSRITASYLSAVGMAELVCPTTDAYERLALDLIADSGARAAVKAKLQANLPTKPLFDSERFVRHLEAAYQMMWDRHATGARPGAIDVTPLDAG
ncbi:MAG: tetratricopeptide repeat protein [Alphaproteobacteria bacterium]|nr:tetratricopeptide repeat protein [Alphaproteobacteria bacterium]MDP6515828.1 tetratricopeptide repeat protein [Alphaproteobacteria bacterium]